MFLPSLNKVLLLLLLLLLLQTTPRTNRDVKQLSWYTFPKKTENRKQTFAIIRHEQVIIYLKLHFPNLPGSSLFILECFIIKSKYV